MKENRLVVGLDLSLKKPGIGVLNWEGKPFDSQCFYIYEVMDFTKAAVIQYKRVKEYLNNLRELGYTIELSLEDTFVAKDPNIVRALNRLSGMVIGFAEDNGIPYGIYSPGTHRASLILEKKSKKKGWAKMKTIEWVESTFDMQVPFMVTKTGRDSINKSDDIADGFSLANHRLLELKKKEEI